MNVTPRKLLTKNIISPVWIIIFWYMLSWVWVLQTDSLEMAGSASQGRIISIITITINVAISSIIMIMTFRILRRYAKTKRTPIQIPFVILILAFIDYFIAWALAFFWYGPESKIDNLLPLGSMSLPLINTPWIFSSRIIGMFGLAGFAWAIIFWLTKKRYQLSLITLAILSLISLIGWLGYQKTDGKTIDTVIISETLNEQIPAITKGDIDLVIFPEYGLEQITNLNLEKRIKINSDHKTYFTGSSQVYETNRYGHENRLLFGNTSDGIVAHQDKYRVIPGGEDLPYLARIGLFLTGNMETLNYFNYSKSVVSSKKQLSPWQTEDLSIGSAVCSSIIAPQDYRHLTKSGANVLTNSASLAIFKGSSIFAWQQQSMAKFMAVANSRYFIQSANGANAYVLDNNGNKTSEASGISSRTTQVNTSRKVTPYTFAGEWTTYAGFVIILVMIPSRIYKKIHRLSKQTSESKTKSKSQKLKE